MIYFSLNLGPLQISLSSLLFLTILSCLLKYSYGPYLPKEGLSNYIVQYLDFEEKYPHPIFETKLSKLNILDLSRLVSLSGIVGVTDFAGYFLTFSFYSFSKKNC